MYRNNNSWSVKMYFNGETAETNTPATEVLSRRRWNFTLSGYCAVSFLSEIPLRTRQPSPSTCDIFRFWEACGSAAVRWCAAAASSGRSVDFGTWNTGLEMFSKLRCQTPPLQQCIYCSLPCYCTPLPQPRRTHTLTLTHSNMCTAPSLLAGSLMLLYGAGACILQPRTIA